MPRWGIPFGVPHSHQAAELSSCYHVAAFSPRPFFAEGIMLQFYRNLLLASVLVVLTSASAFAQLGLSADPDSTLTATLSGLPGEHLQLEDAIARAAHQAAATRASAARLEAARQAVRREKGVFDPEIFGRADWSGADTPSASLFAGAEVLETEDSIYQAGARMKFKLGTELTATINSQRLSSNSIFSALEPEYQSFGALSLRQPLLKGFGPSARSELSFAEHQYQAADARHSQAMLSVRAEVETLYWELYAAERNHAVTIIIRDRAIAFLDDTELRARTGMIGPSQVANADFFLTEAEQALLETEEQLDRFSDRLASLTGRRPQGLRYRPADEPRRTFEFGDQDDMVAATMRHNPFLLELREEINAVRALEDGATWDARPTLDLLGSIGGNGLAGNPQDVFFPGDPNPVRTNIGGDRSDSVNDVFGRDYPTWNVGFVFAVPLGNREGKGERDRLNAEAVWAEQKLLAAERNLEEQVRAQYRELQRGQRRMELATRGVSASIKQVDIGILEYQNGSTTAFEVVRLAADLARAQQRYSDALVRTASAVAVLRQLTGGWYTGDSIPAGQDNNDPKEN